jgi:predicted aldo/keto reductase-like oxidoreductase
MPLNVMDAHFDSFASKVIPQAAKRNMGILGMKPLAFGIALRSGKVTAVECLQYAMNLPISTVITGCDSMQILDQALDTARSFRPLSQEQVAAILKKTENVGQAGQFELYKTSTMFDGTAHNPQWLG